MNIIQLKNELFTDLKTPIGFLSHGGFQTTGTPTTAKRFGSTIYFYDGENEWHEETPVCRVIDSNVNEFKSEEHRIMLQCPKDWAEETTSKLRSAANIAFSMKLCTVHENETFDAFWERCRVPNMLTFEKQAFARRGRRKQYVPIFHGSKELTGVVTPKRDAEVKVMLRWFLCETKDGDRVHVGFRPQFARGIRISKLGGPPPIIRTPWSWLDVDFETLSVPMYGSLIVKMPCFTIETVNNDRVRVSPTSEFKRALEDFHALAMADNWSGWIQVPPGHKKPPVPGSRLMASIMPVQTANNTIQWTAVKHRVLPPRKSVPEAAGPSAPEVVGANRRDFEKDGFATGAAFEENAHEVKAAEKRRADSMDSSCAEKTKRQCT